MELNKIRTVESEPGSFVEQWLGKLANEQRLAGKLVALITTQGRATDGKGNH